VDGCRESCGWSWWMEELVGGGAAHASSAGSCIHGWRRMPLAPSGGRGWRRKHAHRGWLDWEAVLSAGGDRGWRWKHARARVEWIGDFLGAHVFSQATGARVFSAMAQNIYSFFMVPGTSLRRHINYYFIKLRRHFCCRVRIADSKSASTKMPTHYM
jgi:hypothetical protein